MERRGWGLDIGWILDSRGWFLRTCFGFMNEENKAKRYVNVCGKWGSGYVYVTRAVFYTRLNITYRLQILLLWSEQFIAPWLTWKSLLDTEVQRGPGVVLLFSYDSCRERRSAVNFGLGDFLLSLAFVVILHHLPLHLKQLFTMPNVTFSITIFGNDDPFQFKISIPG